MAEANEENRQDNAAKDIFFLNIEDAYAEAVKQNEIGGNQVRRLQYCYYDGVLTDIVLPNFIRVPADDFVAFFSHNQLPIPKLIAVSQPDGVNLSPMPQDIVDEIEAHRKQYTVAESTHFDSYFIDPLLALNVAKQRNRVYCGHPTIDGLQLCYYRGELPEHGLENLVHVELHELVDFFVQSKLRLPANVEIPDELEAELKSSVRQDIASALNTIDKKREMLIDRLIEKARTQEPLIDGGPIRVFIPSRRMSTVMQHCSRSVAKAFEKKGFQVCFYIEDSDMETINYVDFIKTYIDFNPHAVFFINCLRGAFYHEDVVNLVWWQDPMQQILKRELLEWRKNDFNFSVSLLLDDYLKQCGAATVGRQHFVIDDVFYADPAQSRQPRVVFVGTSYRMKVDFSDSRHQQAVEELAAILERGGRLDKDTVAGIAERSGLDYEFVFWKLLHYAVRDNAVQWLCRQATLPVDVYGRYWDQDQVVEPFFRGELPHGVEVANLYRSAEYALVCHPFEINSQRLAEVAACGCIPVVYDCRDVAEMPHWEQCCLFFKTEAELKHILDNRLQPPESPLLLARYFTYDAAVEHFIEKSALKTLLEANTVEPAKTHTEPVLGNNVVLHSRSADTVRVGRNRLAKNLEVLKNSWPSLFDEVIEGIEDSKVDIIIDRLIGSAYWDVSLAINGDIYYRLDNIALLDNYQLICDNADVHTRENTSCYALLSLGSGYELMDVFAQTQRPIPEMEEFEVPVYVIEQQPELLVLNMLLHDWEPVITSKRVQFFNHNAIDRLCEAFLQFQVALPTVLLDTKVQGGLRVDQMLEFIKQAQQQRAQRHVANLHEVHEYYGAITDDEWREKFKPENISSLRVMGFISRFSSFLKYCIRDLLDGFERLSAVTTTCIEKENYYLTNIEYFIEQINSFKPDIILTINHFRHEFVGVPESIPFVNWIQDMLSNITGNKQALKAKDFTFVFVKSWVGLNEFSIYKDSPIEFLPVGYNDKIYFPINEQKNYDCDVLVVTHLQDPERGFAPIRNPEEFHLFLNEHETKIIDAGIISGVELIELYRTLDEHISSLNISEFNKFCTMRGADTIDDINVLTVDEFNSVFYKKNITLDPRIMEVLYPLTGNRLHCEYLSKMKTWPVSLLIDSCADIRIHLYGRNWNRYPKFKKFARGLAGNGESLNRIMNNARICLNASPGITLHMRAIEIMASGSFMLSRKNEHDKSPLSDYFSDEQVALYDDEDDFINKVGFYLENEYERNRIAQNALSRTQEIFSYKAIAENMLSSVNMRLFK